MQVKYLVTKQSVVYHCNVKHCITRDNIPVVARATVVLRVRGNADDGEDTNLVRKFAYGLGVRGLETQLASAVVRTFRSCLASAVYVPARWLRLTSSLHCPLLSRTNYLSLELDTFFTW